jgi:PAS domain S-box-containing protein
VTTKEEVKIRDYCADVLDAANAIVVQLDRECRIVFCNKKAEEVLGFTRKQLKGKNWIQNFIPKNQRKQMKKKWKKVLKGCLPPEFVNPIKTRSGKQKQFSWNNKPLKDSKGKVTGIISVGVDVTEKQKVLKDLRESEERFKTLFDKMADPVVLISKDGTLLEVTQKVKNLTGYSREELVGKNLSEIPLLDSENKKKAAKSVSKRFSNKKLRPYELELTKKNGNKIVFEVNGQIINYKGEKADLVVLRNLTQRKKMEKALKGSEQEKTTILKSMNELVTYQDPELKILWANPAAEKSAGKKFKKIVGKHCYSIWPKRKTPCPGCPVIKAFKSGKQCRSEMQTPDGRFWLITGYPVKDEKGKIKGVVETTLNITARKKAEEELKESEKRYRSMVERLEDVLYRFSLETNSFEYVSPSIKYLTGLPAKKFLEDASLWEKMVHPDYKQVIKELENIEKRFERPTSEIKMIDSKGKEKWVQQSSVIVYDNQGKAIALEGILRDVTQEKEALQRVRKNQEMHEKLFSLLDVWVWETDAQGNCVYSNQSVKKFLGFTPEDLNGKSVFDLALPSEKNKLKQKKKQVSKEKQGVKQLESVLVCKDGTLKPVELTAVPITNEKNQVTGFFGVSRDLTRKQEIESHLKEWKKTRDTVLSRFGQFFFRMGVPTGEYQYLSPQAEKVLGKPVKKMLKNPAFPLKLIHPDSREYFKEKWEELRKGIVSPVYEYDIIDANGKRKKIVQSQVGVYDSSGRLTAIEGVARQS